MSHTHLPSTTDVCPSELAGFLSTPFRRLLHKPEIILAGLIQPGQSAADFGCGPGYFTLEVARQVGEGGKVFAVDLQQNMLNLVARSAARAGLLQRITLHRVDGASVRLPEPIDFALCFWMIHEVPDRERFLREIYDNLRPNGTLLMVEPYLHVGSNDFRNSVNLAIQIGFTPIRSIAVAISRSQLFIKPPVD